MAAERDATEPTPPAPAPPPPADVAPSATGVVAGDPDELTEAPPSEDSGQTSPPGG